MICYLGQCRHYASIFSLSILIITSWRSFPKGWCMWRPIFWLRHVYHLDLLHCIYLWYGHWDIISKIYYLACYIWLYTDYDVIMLMSMLWLWCYHAYADALIMMLWCYNFYDVTMLMRLLCCSYHHIPLFHNDYVCLFVILGEMWYVWCGTWIPIHDVIDLMILCDGRKWCW